MKTAKSSGLLACAGLCALLLLSGCGGSSSNTTIPASTTIFFAHSAIFKNTSTLTMGYNAFGQLGLGNLDTKAVATVVPNLGPMDRVAAGGDHTIACSFTNLSTVYAWGSNYHGQIGSSIATTGTSAFSATPVRISLHQDAGRWPATKGVVAGVAAGWYHSLALVEGTVFSWGYGGNGQLGPRSTVSSTLTNADDATPLQVQNGGAPLSNIKQIAAGGATSFALVTDGTVYSWGDNSNGQLGRTPLNGLNDGTPTLVKGADQAPFGDVQQIAAAGSNAYALKNDGTVWAWGYNGMGQLGKSPLDIPAIGNNLAVTATLSSTNPVKILKSDGKDLIATKIIAGWDHVLVLLADGTVMAWGFNEYAQLGNGLTANSFVPVTVSADQLGNPLTGVVDIAAFGNSSLALLQSGPGNWVGWGDNGFGQLASPISSTSLSKLFIPVPIQRQ